MHEGSAELPRVAVVGCGRWGANHVRNYAELGALGAVVDARRDVAADFASRYGVRSLTFAEALAEPALEAMVFALPPSQNLPLGLRVLEAGKHLFVEKPLALSVADGEVLCRTAEGLGRCLMVGHILQYHPAFLALAEIVRAQGLGPLLSVVSTRLDLGRIRREEDALWALAPHDISMVLALVGAEPGSVRASGGWHTDPVIADSATLDLRFDAGLRAEIRVSWLHPFKEQKLAVIGRDAMAVFDDREDWASKLVMYPHRVSEPGEPPSAERADPVVVTVEQGEPLRRECLAFLQCIRNGARPPSDGREALRVLRVLERASAALRAEPDVAGRIVASG